VDLTIIEG
jgi:protein YIPF1/2